MILEFFATILLIVLFWLLPAILVSFIILKIAKRKISKGWCILVFIFCALFSAVTSLLVGLDWSKFGTIWQFFCYCTVWSSVSAILYNKNIPSIFDTEKQLKEKLNKQNEIQEEICLVEHKIDKPRNYKKCFIVSLIFNIFLAMVVFVLFATSYYFYKQAEDSEKTIQQYKNEYGGYLPNHTGKYDIWDENNNIIFKAE